MEAMNKRRENLIWPDEDKTRKQLEAIREIAKELRMDYPTDTADEPTNRNNEARNRRNTLIRAQFSTDKTAWHLINGTEWLELFDLLGFSVDKETRKRFTSHLNWYSFWYADFKPRLSSKYAQRIHWYVYNFLFCLRNKLQTEKDYREGKYGSKGQAYFMKIEKQPAIPTETPQISTETAETVNVSARGQNAEKSAEMPQILNCEWQTKESFKKIPNITKLAKAGIIINGVGWHTEYLDLSHNVLARVDNLSWDMELHTFPYQGSGVFGKTALFECWEEAVIATIDALTEHLQAWTVNEPIKHISEIMETCPTYDPEARDYTDEYKYYTWLANHILEHEDTNKNVTEIVLEEVRERISAAATLKAHGVPKCDIEGAVCAVVNRLAKIEDILQFYSHTEPPQSPETPQAAECTSDSGCRVCSHCGKHFHEGWFLGNEYACSEECAVALYGGDRELFEADLETEENEPGTTECYWSVW